MKFNRDELKTIRSALDTAIQDRENEVAIDGALKQYSLMELRKMAPLYIRINSELEMKK